MGSSLVFLSDKGFVMVPSRDLRFYLTFFIDASTDEFELPAI
jgi:hypothetical protein